LAAFCFRADEAVCTGFATIGKVSPSCRLTEGVALRTVDDALDKPNSDSEMTELIRNAHFLRGAIISSYAEVEFLLTDLNMRCRAVPAYAAIAAGLPYKLESKIVRNDNLHDR
jgi:hypothetical protein